MFEMFHSFKVKYTEGDFQVFSQVLHLVLMHANPVMLIHSDKLTQKPNWVLSELSVSSVTM